MFLAIRDLRRGIRRFALVGLVVALVASLSTVLAGLADGLVRDGTSGLKALPLSHLAFQPHAEASFSRSTLDDDALDIWRSAAEGTDVEVTPLGMSFVNAQPVSGDGSAAAVVPARDATTIDVALFGVAPGSFLLPDERARQSVQGQAGLVLSHELADEGVEVGDRFLVAGSDVELPVLGFTFTGSYGHVPIGYTSLEAWQSLQYGSDPRGRFSAIAVSDTEGIDVAAVDLDAGTDTITKTAAFAGSPGYSAETMTMTLIRGFLLVIAALIIGAFFTVMTIQRTSQIGLLKAMGASTGYVLRDSLAQITIVVVVATALGAAVGMAITSSMSDAVPIDLTTNALVTTVLSLVAASVVGSLVALRRITSVEPAIALGVHS